MPGGSSTGTPTTDRTSRWSGSLALDSRLIEFGIVIAAPSARSFSSSSISGASTASTSPSPDVGATVVGVTSGNADRVAEFSKVECRDKFAVAADPDKKISAQYDAVIPVVGYTDRVSYVITPNGKVALSYSAMNPDQHVAKTMAAVKAWKSGGN